MKYHKILQTIENLQISSIITNTVYITYIFLGGKKMVENKKPKGKNSLLRKRNVVIVVILIAIVVGGVAIKANIASGASVASVEYLEATVSTGDIAMSVSGSGSIEAKSRSEIRSETSGTVYDIFATVGDYVNEGDLLFSVQSNSLSNATESDRLNYVSATNSLNNLYDDLSELKVYANNDGTVSLTTETIGDSVNAGQIVASITDESNMQILAPFSPDLISKINVGDTAQIVLDGYYVAIDGVVSKVGTSAKPYESGLLYYEVTIDFENPGALSAADTAIVSVVNSSGNLKAMFSQNLKESEGSTVRLDVTAELEKLYVSNGDYVNKGDLIAEFSSEALEEQIQSQNISVAQQKLSYEKSLGDSAVYSPVSGTVVSVLADEGDSIDDNTVTVVVSNIDELKAVIPIDEADINKVKVGQEAVVSFQSDGTTTFDGEVVSLSLEGSEKSGTVVYDATIAIVPNDDGDRLLPNMNVNATISLDSSSDTLLLPIEAVQSRGDNYFVVTDPDAEGQDKMTFIEVGLISKDSAEVISGLAEGDIVYYPKAVGTGASSDDTKMMVPGMGMGGGGGGKRP